MDYLSLRVFTLLVLSALLGVNLRPCAAEVIRDGVPERVEYAKAVQQVLAKEDFATLEQQANELRKTKARFPEGVWKLPVFYAGVTGRRAEASDRKTDEEWKVVLAKLERWQAKYPESVTAKVALGAAWKNYGWDARGGETASKVTETGWQLFAERLARAREILESARKLPTRCPELYHQLFAVAQGQGWPRKEFEQLYEEAVAFEPEYYELYFKKAHYLLPRWYGKPGEWERFAEEAAAKTESQQGMTLYTRIVWAQSGWYPRHSSSNIFAQCSISWPKMKQGFEDIEKQYPDSLWNLNAFCYFACRAGDRDTAHTLFTRLDNRISTNVWRSTTYYDKCQKWAAGSRYESE